MVTTTKRLKFGKELLKYTAERDASVIYYDFIIDKNITRDLSIKFKCGKCGEDGEKIFRILYEKGCFCKTCSGMICIEKQRQTNLERYGVENPFQSSEIKEKIKATNLEQYGVEKPCQSSEIKEKIKATNIKRYGFENPFQSPEMKDKIKATNIKRYGFENPFQSPEMKDKIKATNLQRYGVEYPMQSMDIQDKRKTANLERHGVEYPWQSADVQDKMKATNLERYGVENAMHNAEVAEKAGKAAYNLKDFTYPCGNTIQVQGYEPFALKYLIVQGYTHRDITTKRTDVPEIWYVKGERPARYFCDIFIAKENRIIEVKSPWTYEKDKEDLVLKEQACVDAGHTFELQVYDAKGNRVILDQ